MRLRGDTTAGEAGAEEKKETNNSEVRENREKGGKGRALDMEDRGK